MTPPEVQARIAELESYRGPYSDQIERELIHLKAWRMEQVIRPWMVYGFTDPGAAIVELVSRGLMLPFLGPEPVRILLDSSLDSVAIPYLVNDGSLVVPSYGPMPTADWSPDTLRWRWLFSRTVTLCCVGGLQVFGMFAAGSEDHSGGGCFKSVPYEGVDWGSVR